MSDQTADQPLDADAGVPAPDAGTPADPAEVALKLLEEQKDKYLRLAAEYDNYRKRTAKEKFEAEARGQSAIVRELLDAIDDLRRFATLDPSTLDAPTLHEAVVMVEKKFAASFAKSGLELLDPAAAPFDPALHEAVGTMPNGDAALDGQVAQVYQVGYRFAGQLLRPARVVVWQYQAGAGPH